jgi:ATP-dependent DNA helicase DinG
MLAPMHAPVRNAASGSVASSPRCGGEAWESDIIIVNHHLFFADLAIKLQADGAPDAGILPDAAAVVFDEAHELEDVAGNYFGISVSNLRVDDLARDVERSMQQNRMLSASVSGALGSLREKSQFFFSLLPPGEGRFAFENAPGVSGGKWR